MDKNNNKKYIKSPLNYIGGKYKLLPQILPLFPNNIDTFVDLFGGGFNIGINIEANKIIYNDCVYQLSHMLKKFYNTETNVLLKEIKEVIDSFDLSKTNREGFVSLRNRYNKRNTDIDLYILICYAFNNQIRFNSKGEYNMPFGMNRSSFNNALEEKFITFVETMHKKNIKFTYNSFNDLKVDKLSSKDFVYLDPPYFNTTATYNENGGWGFKQEKELRELCEKLTKNKIKFALSNNLFTNETLLDWANSNGYIIHYLNATYSNCNYQKKDKETKDIEVLITNY